MLNVTSYPMLVSLGFTRIIIGGFGVDRLLSDSRQQKQNFVLFERSRRRSGDEGDLPYGSCEVKSNQHGSPVVTIASDRPNILEVTERLQYHVYIH